MARATNTARLDELAALEILRGADAVLDAVERLSPGYARPDHLRSVAQFFADAARGKPARLVLSSAPRFGKTTAFEHGIAWLMFTRPGVRVVVVCCTASLAEQISRRVRTLVERLGLRLARDQRALDLWAAANGSSLRAIGAGGALVGVGADVLVCDDLVPSMEAAQSPAQREHTEQWFESTALGRLEPGAAVLVCAHRWAVDDISGRLIARGWPVANVPALDPVTGESGWPTRWTTAALRDKEREVGPLVWAALYQGQPRPRGGQVFPLPPTFYDRDDLVAMMAAQTCRLALVCDPAASAKTSADWSVVALVAFHGHGRDLSMDLVDVWRRQVEIPALVDHLVAEQRRWRCVVGVESVGGFLGIAQTLRRVNPDLRVSELRATSDKLTRALPASAAWCRGAIRVPTSAPWLPAFLDEVGAFTGTGADRHDDQVDAALSHAWTMGALVGLTDLRNRQRGRIAAALPFG